MWWLKENKFSSGGIDKIWWEVAINSGIIRGVGRSLESPSQKFNSRIGGPPLVVTPLFEMLYHWRLSKLIMFKNLLSG